jgi:hypothetical protein
MECIRYRDTRIDNETVERLRQKMKENPEHGVALFNGYRKYANLQLWRSQQLHEYLGVRVESYGNYLLCSCGLEALESDIESVAIAENALPEAIVRLNLSKLIRVRFHVDFTDNPQRVNALIVDTSYEHDSQQRFFSAYCQICLDYTIDAKHRDAIKFVASHNSAHIR